jgi:1-acyl-sn-glycerol-3-phosphate acyltransferase
LVPPRLARRILMPLVLALVIVVLALSVLASVLGLISALVDKRARLLRIAVMVGIYAALDLTVVVLMFMISLRRLGGAGNENSEAKTVGRALGIFLGAARAVCGFRIELEEPPTLEPFECADPVLVLARHGGLGDSFALVHLLITRYGRTPRVVLKSVLLWDPMLDAALTRLGACWIGPSSRGAARDSIGRVAAGLKSKDALLLFPEGKNWTPRRRMSALLGLWKSGHRDAVKAAALMEHVLPPKSGGVVACLDAQPDIPVVIMAHTGLDQITSLGALWTTLPFTVPMRLRWWPAAPAPTDEDDRLQWLTTEWAVVDQWIDASRSDSRPADARSPTVRPG